MHCFKNVRDAVGFAPEKFKKVALFDSDRMFCDVYGLNAGQEQVVHSHPDSDKVYFVLDGVARFQIGDESREVGSGFAVWAPAGKPHAVHNAGPEPLSLLVFMAPKPTHK